MTCIAVCPWGVSGIEDDYNESFDSANVSRIAIDHWLLTICEDVGMALCGAREDENQDRVLLRPYSVN